MSDVTTQQPADPDQERLFHRAAAAYHERVVAERGMAKERLQRKLEKQQAQVAETQAALAALDQEIAENQQAAAASHGKAGDVGGGAFGAGHATAFDASVKTTEG